jgi:hypothetical protein
VSLTVPVWVHTGVQVKGKESTLKPCQMLDPIKQAKYPAITAEEEKISIPLQTLCQVRRGERGELH